MRVHSGLKSTDQALGRLALHLDELPLRPLTARLLLEALPEVSVDDAIEAAASPRIRSTCELDPGWVLAHRRAGRRSNALEWLSGRSWWPRTMASGPLGDLLARLWRHSVAVGIGSRWLAREAGDPDPDAVAGAGQLASLGYWAIAAVAPEWLLSWWREPDPARRARGGPPGSRLRLRPSGSRASSCRHGCVSVCAPCWVAVTIPGLALARPRGGSPGSNQVEQVSQRPRKITCTSSTVKSRR